MRMNWTLLASVYGAFAVIAGAFGAHGLKARLTADQLSNWNTATEYHLLHSVVLLALALYHHATGRSIQTPALLFAFGIVFFSGSIYGLVLTDQRWLWPVTPIGGVLLIGGWVSMLVLERG